MKDKYAPYLIIFSIFCAVGLLGTLVDPEPIDPWRLYTISILYGIGVFHSVAASLNVLLSSDKE